MLTFYVVLLVAGAQDLIAQELEVSIIVVTRTLQVLVFLLPLAAAWLTWRICRDLGAIEPRPPITPDVLAGIAGDDDQGAGSAGAKAGIVFRQPDAG